MCIFDCPTAYQILNNQLQINMLLTSQQSGHTRKTVIICVIGLCAWLMFLPNITIHLTCALRMTKDSAKSANTLTTSEVIILSNFRTGSSFVSEFLNQHKDVFYVFEPFFKHGYRYISENDIGSLVNVLNCDFNETFLCPTTRKTFVI